MSETFAVIAGGGTGGHVIPAIAIARALVDRGHPRDSIHFVGSRRGIEGRLVPAAGFPITVLPGRGLVRGMAPANLAAASGIIVAVIRAVALLGRLRPSVVVSVGGYASVPCTVAASVWRIPLVVAEQNAVPGAANRLAGKVAVAAATSFPGTALPRATLTGNPVRAEVLAVDRRPSGRAAARAELGLPAEGAVIAVVTGSLGSRRVNRAVVELAERWADRPGVAINHVIGERDWAELGARGAPQPGLQPVEQPGQPAGLFYRKVRFEERMDLLYASADVAVGRAGATSVAELAVVGLPAVLVPLPGAPGDHQTRNARNMEAAGAAVVVPDRECDAQRLGAELDALLGDPVALVRMGEAARRAAHPGAADAVATLVEKHSRG
ncbi:MAG TPA: UDP-N-acetylglucosamine--N-acetylmuramyl-(pentapeptide) pyrophosphoryl-undecaprenol N-acetylglucosamine transferase [Acidimicrobiales bacterium]|nr:UDP-N-acetylglucosamine--N-acetylmuramyl-(pentapeptide) pyrophosphoryl-undecaprenol N-acetylglucosamine transferase [Acidimicrobiales bacterium]